MKIALPLLLLLCFLSLLVGSVSLSLQEVVDALLGGGDDMARFVVIESRLPQMITAVLAGIAL